MREGGTVDTEADRSFAVRRPPRIVLVAFLGATSCSLLGIRPVPERRSETSPLACRSWAWPVVDTVLSFGVFDFNEAVGNSCFDAEGSCPHKDKTLGYVVGSVFAASVLYGVIANSLCQTHLPPSPTEDK